MTPRWKRRGIEMEETLVALLCTGPVEWDHPFFGIIKAADILDNWDTESAVYLSLSSSEQQSIIDMVTILCKARVKAIQISCVVDCELTQEYHQLRESILTCYKRLFPPNESTA